MKLGAPFTLLALILFLTATACRKESTQEKGEASPPVAGALYSVSDGEGGFRICKVVGVSEEVVFVSLFSNRWTSRPLLEQAEKASTSAPVAYSPATFAGMQPVFLKNGTVAPEELEAFEEWKRGNRETF